MFTFVLSLLYLVMFTFVLSLLYLARLTVLVRGFAVPHIDHKD
jgi:hypothetical protein